MVDESKAADKLVWFLRERAKELNCLYKIEEALNKPDARLDDVCQAIIDSIPPGWQYPEFCVAMIAIDENVYRSKNFKETEWKLSADIVVQDEVFGEISVYYTKEMPQADIGPFLKDEAKLIKTIADRLAHFISFQIMKQLYQEWQQAGKELSDNQKKEWRVVIDLIHQTDRNLYLKISHKMLNHLCWSGIETANKLLQYYNPESTATNQVGDDNRPRHKSAISSFSDFLSDETFKIAADHLSDSEIFSLIQKWIQEDKFSFLVRLVNRNLPLSEVAAAVRKYHHTAPQDIDLPPTIKKGVIVSLIRRFFSGRLHYINVAKNYLDVDDFYDLIQNIIFAPESHGNLGGKSAGLYLAAQILKKHAKDNPELSKIKVPKTWYLTSDMLLHFMHYNHLDEIIEQKYKEIDQVRLEYPHVVQTFKNSFFPPEILTGLSAVLDDFKDNPLIVRSSSLLEDGVGAAFSGKYKSLFLANQGDKESRLNALVDAIAEVYASTFGPDPIEYRAERGLLDFHEEMGIMIQEVVGTRVGNYFFPAFAGVLFSRNEFRWSPRIKREDGLIRIVPGLGTRAVDRVADDYPVLIAPGQPDLRVNVSPDEILRYSPLEIDVINLETNSFETIPIAKLLKDYGEKYPMFNLIFSIYDGDSIRALTLLGGDYGSKELVVTFDGLIKKTQFMSQVRSMLKLLEEKLGTPVDVEFAHNGTDFYILQCRPQSYSDDNISVPIPRDVAPEKVLFTANRFVSNGRVPEISHIVYVDPEKYGELSERSELYAVGRAVSALNKILPKRQFILMGPGRWGSRGDIKLGVSVTYSDINNTSLMIEIARRKGNYLPDLSFGTHFFQDLVEARIRYLPLYPDDKGVIFNEKFFRDAPNIMAEVIPEFAHLSHVVKLIDIPKATGGLILQILLNADLDEAMAILTSPKGGNLPIEPKTSPEEPHSENHWRWRMRMAEQIAAQLDARRFGVKGFYVFGSTKNGTAGPKSDIDILIYFDGSQQQLTDLKTWLEGWSLCLAEMNFLQTGFRSGGLLDVHFITDDDIAKKTSYAIKINAVTDPARELPIRR